MRFIGRVHSISPESARVTLTNIDTGEALETAIGSELLHETGIGIDDEFDIETSGFVTRLQPKDVAVEFITRMRRRFRDRWDFR
jgi:hypothetical protein